MAVEREVRGATVGEAEVLYGHLGPIANFKVPQTRDPRWEDRVEGGRKHEAGVGLDCLIKGAGATCDLQNGGAVQINLASCAMNIFAAAGQIVALVHFACQNVARDEGIGGEGREAGLTADQVRQLVQRSGVREGRGEAEWGGGG